MRCPFCNHEDTQVLDTRDTDDGSAVRRRRKCAKPECDRRFTTYERADVVMPVVVKKDGSRVEFQPSKLRASMQLALRKRPVSIEQIDQAVERIKVRLLTGGQREVPSSHMGDLIMEELKRVDKVAYVRFASVYRSFEDVDEFRQIIRDI